MKKIPPAVRLSLSLTLLTVSIFFVAEFIGLVPNRVNDLTAARAVNAESLAVQLSVIASSGDRNVMDYTIAQYVKRNEDILSAAIRGSDERLITSSGGHEEHWGSIEDETSTLTHMQVPLFRENKPWGRVEVRFESIWGGDFLDFLRITSIDLILFIALSGGLLFYVFLRKALSELNPSRVIPERVRAAFDVLAEGVLILDGNERIVLANTSIAERLGQHPDDLVGRRPSDFAWVGLDALDKDIPWIAAMANNVVTDVAMQLSGPNGETYKFMVNGTPIQDGNDKVRGALATFDDLSNIEEKNEELRESLGSLEESRNKISQKNKELEYLAMRDPLTGCYNRRSFFELFNEKFDQARATSEPLSCLMIDIDHFKAVNDDHGHAVGDEVIKRIADLLNSDSRAEDIVGRYGGEEFCLLSPGLTSEQARELGERLRRSVGASTISDATISVTVSIGVAILTDEIPGPMDLVNLADQALYVAKETGRDRVECYDPEIATASAQSKLDAPVTPPSKIESQTGSAEQQALIDTLQRQVHDLEHQAKELSDREWQDSLHDKLTGLPNRALLMDRTEQAVKRINRDGGILAVLSIEMDILQRVRDAFGHDAAEKLLKSLSERLMDIFRDTDTVGLLAQANGSAISRTDTNEFIILCNDVANIESVTWILGRIQNALESPLAFGDEEILFSGNIGISVCPNDANDVEELLEASAIARGHARDQGGRLNVAFYSREMNRTSKKQLRMESLLHKGILDNECVLHYQPKTDVQTGQVVGVEALARWDSPELGMVSPLEFIPIVERCGLMPQLTKWVIEQSCKQLKAWQPLGLGDLRLAINVSPIDLRDPEFGQKLLTYLDSQDVAAKSLEIEITETGVIENMETAANTLTFLQENSVILSLDDFGTGYSSLNHLNALPLDVLKIDRCFVQDIHLRPRNEAIVKAIVAMASATGLHVVAEGVEVDEEFNILKRLGCDEIQGYIDSEPLPADEITEFIIARNASAPKRKPVSGKGRVINLIPRWLGTSHELKLDRESNQGMK